MSEPAGRAARPSAVPAAARDGEAASPARREVSQRRAWFAAAASYAAIGTVFQVLPPYTAAIGHDLGVSATAAGLGMTVFLLPVPLLAVPAGAFCDRHGSGLLTRAGFAILLASVVLLAAVPGFGWLLAARAAGGLGAGLLMVGALKTHVIWSAAPAGRAASRAAGSGGVVQRIPAEPGRRAGGAPVAGLVLPGPGADGRPRRRASGRSPGSAGHAVLS